MASRPQSRPRPKRETKPRFRVGDRISFIFGLDRVKGTVIEDRGELGIGGIRIFRVRVPRAYTDDMITEVPDDALQAER